MTFLIVALAAAELRSALDLAPGIVDAHRMLARYAYHYQRWPELLDESTSILAWTRHDPDAEQWAGHALLQEQNWPEAIRVLRAAVAGNERLPQARRDLALALKA